MTKLLYAMSVRTERGLRRVSAYTATASDQIAARRRRVEPSRYPLEQSPMTPQLRGLLDDAIAKAQVARGVEHAH